jgi:excisionase family DNA binding protein
MSDEQMTMSVLEACKRLGISKNLGYDAIRRGEIPAIRIGKRLLISRAVLEKMLSEGGTTSGS